MRRSTARFSSPVGGAGTGRGAVDAGPPVNEVSDDTDRVPMTGTLDSASGGSGAVGGGALTDDRMIARTRD